MLENPMYLATPDDSPNQDLAIALKDDKTITGFGRRQHGLNGKNADLDRGGQCCIDSIFIDDPIGATTLFIVAEVSQYASICEYSPDEDVDDEKIEAIRELQGEVVSTWSDYPGEWTGSDYWTFTNEVTVKIPLDLDDYEKGATQNMIRKYAARLYKAICKNESVLAFEKNMGELADAVGECINYES